MNKKQLSCLILTGALATGILSGCSKNETTVINNPKEVPAMEQAVVEVTEAIPEKKTYQPYEHVFFKRYYSASVDTGYVYGGQIVIPEGYEILEIENVTKKSGYGSRTAGFDVWFINNKVVEASPVYNEAFGYYDYSEPGTVVELEVEEEGPTLKLTP